MALGSRPSPWSTWDNVPTASYSFTLLDPQQPLITIKFKYIPGSLKVCARSSSSMLFLAWMKSARITPITWGTACIFSGSFWNLTCRASTEALRNSAYWVMMVSWSRITDLACYALAGFYEGMLSLECNMFQLKCLLHFLTNYCLQHEELLHVCHVHQGGDTLLKQFRADVEVSYDGKLGFLQQFL